MATADEILATMAEEAAATDQMAEVCTIDRCTRAVTIPEALRIVGVETDKDVTRRHFKVLCSYRGTNLSTFRIRIHFMNANKEKDIYYVTDAAQDGEYLTFSWVISRNATKYKGRLQFIACMVCDGGTDEEREWNSTLGEFTVLEGLEVELTDGEEEQARDAITQLLAVIDARESEAVEAVRAAGAETIASIPKDYTALHNNVVYNANNIAALRNDVYTRNLYNVTTVTNGKAIDGGGNVYDAPGYTLSDYIPVQSGKSLYFSVDGAGVQCQFVHQFDAAGKLISNLLYVDNPYIVPDGVASIRVTTNDYYINRDKFQIEYDGVTEYIQHETKNDALKAEVQTELGSASDACAIPVEWLEGMFITTGGVRTEYATSRIAYIRDMKPHIGKTLKVKTYAYGSMAYIITDANWNTLLTGTSGNPTNSNAEWEFEVTIPENAGRMQVSYDYTHGVEFEMYEKTSVWDVIASMKPSVENPLRVIRDDPGLLSCFFEVGCIGNSLASGIAVYKDETGNVVVDSVNRYEHSWGQYLARMTGNKYYNWSAGGMRTDTWLASRFATECFDGQHLCQAYIIGLAQNDYNHSKTVGTAADIDTADYNNNADTFYGRYAKIIQRIKEVQPKAKIFVITDPWENVETAGYNAAIRHMATAFANVYVMDMHAHWSAAPCAAFLENNKRYGHYNAVGYYTIAKMIMTYIDWIMQRQWQDFREIENIGTDWYYYE